MFYTDVDTFDLSFKFSLVHFIIEIRLGQKNRAKVNDRPSSLFRPVPNRIRFPDLTPAIN